MFLYFRIIVGFLSVLIGTSASADEFRINGFPSGTDFFPIGVWLQSPVSAAKYKSIGINTFVGLYDGPTDQQLAALARENMFAAAQQNDVGLNTSTHVIKAWLQDDEPDNAQPLPIAGYGTCIAAVEVARRTREIKNKDPSRPVLINFGQGVANEFWRGRGPCNGDQGYYDVAMQAPILCRSISIYLSIPSARRHLR